jgi:haloalkane dehalogenase
VERPDWVDSELYPFEDRWAEVDGSSVHYVDEGEGPPLLMLHGNPTWSFTWREVIKGLSDRYRCIALDYPGFGLSTTAVAPGYAFRPQDHARVVHQFAEQLDLQDVTLLMQDWGGPIGGYLIKRRNFFVERIIPGGTKRVGPDDRVMEHYRRPFPTPASRVPMHVFPRAIIGETEWLKEVERGLTSLDDRPALILWPTKDQAFGDGERKRWEATFTDHRTVTLEGAGHYIGEDAPAEIVAALRV